MATPKRPPLPLILLANDLLDGEIVFWTGDGWSPLPADALLARDEDTAVALEAAAAAGLAAQKVVEASLVDVTVASDGGYVPRHARERIKTLGPTTRRDLGKQAGLFNIALADR